MGPPGVLGGGNRNRRCASADRVAGKDLSTGVGALTRSSFPPRVNGFSQPAIRGAPLACSTALTRPPSCQRMLVHAVDVQQGSENSHTPTVLTNVSLYRSQATMRRRASVAG